MGLCDHVGVNWYQKAIGFGLCLALVMASCGGSELELSPLAEEGRELTLTRGCSACHGEDGAGDVGAPLKGLYGSMVELEDGTTVLADTEFIRRSIVDPKADVAAGYTISMPETTLSDAEIDAVVAYIEELQ